ncbi:lamin tail domain-containing protein [bacterium]|nr:lamin tail domain-containing protein [bacterium]
MRGFRWVFVLTLLVALWGTASAQIVITEIMNNPSAVSDSDGEFVELYNSTASAIDIDGWTLADNGSDSHVIDNGGELLVPAFGYLVLGINSDSGTNGGITVAYQYSGISMANGDDEVMLYDTDMTLIDEVFYDGGPDFPDPNGASMYLVDPTVDNNLAGAWLTSTIAWAGGAGDFGSPGAANETPKYETFNNADVESWTWRVGEAAPDYFFSATAWLGDSNFIAENQVDAHGGTSAVMMGMINEAENSFLYQSLAAIPDAAYEFSAWLKDEDPDMTANLSIVFYNDDGDQLGSVDSDPTVDGGSYVQFTMEATAPEGATRMSVGVEYINTNSSGTHFILADDFDLGAAPPPPPVITLGELQTNTETYLDSEIETGGIVMNLDGVFSDSQTKTYIQDGTGFGVMLFSFTGGLLSDLAIGDSVSVVGTVDEYSGTTEIVDFEVTVISSGNPIPEPLTFGSIFDVTNAQALEGTYTEITGTILNPVGTGSYNLYVSDGSSDISVRYHEGLGADMSEADPGDTLTVRGVIGIYNGASQIYPYMADDWEIGGRLDGPANWDFENWTDTGTISWPNSWRLGDAETMTAVASEENVLDGDYSAEITITDGEGTSTLQQVLWAVEVGGHYEIVANVLDNDPGVDVFLSAAFLDADGELVGTAVSSEMSVDNAEYQELMVVGDGFEGIAAVEISIVFEPTVSFSETATVFLDGFVGGGYSPTTIADIQTDEDPLGHEVVVTGIVTQGAGLTAGFNDVYIQDDSGYGIQLYDGTVQTELVRGAEVRVWGTVDEFSGVTEIVDFGFEVLSNDNELPAPLLGVTGDMATNQALEGTWAQVTGYIQNDVGTPSWTLYLDDGSGEVQVRVWGDTGIDLSAFSRYDNVTVRGVIDLYQGAVQIQPSLQADLEAAIPFPAPTDLTVTPSAENILLEWAGFEEPEEGFLYFAVYRNGGLVGTVAEGASFTDVPFDYGELTYTVRAYYDMGVSLPTDDVMVEWAHPLWTPTQVEHDLVQETGEVTLSWLQGGSYGEGVEEIYDDTEAWTGSYIWPGNTMAARFEVEGPVEVIGLKYFTTIAAGARQFNAEMYEWDSENQEPASVEPIFTTAAMGADDAWVVLDMSASPVVVESDIIVGFGSIDGSVAVGFEPAEGWLNTWDLTGEGWVPNSFNERYGIRMIVRPVEPVEAPAYEIPVGHPVAFRGTVAEERLVREIRPNELDDLTQYTVLRDGEEVSTVTESMYEETLPAFGTYEYSVVANYDEGDSEAATETVEWTDTAVEDGQWDGIPTEYAIASAYPNPFNPSMNVVLAIPKTGHVEAQVYDVLGRRVATLSRGNLTAGYHRFVWQPQNLPTGMYFLRMQSTTGFVATRKVMFMK